MTNPTPSYLRRYVGVLRDIMALIEAEMGGKPTDRGSMAYKIHALALAAVTRKRQTSQAKNMLGKRFGRLVVLREAEERRANRAVDWIAICDCGREFRAEGASMRRGKTKSCGCLRGENLRIGHRSPLPRIYSGGYHTPPLTEARVCEAGWFEQRGGGQANGR